MLATPTEAGAERRPTTSGAERREFDRYDVKLPLQIRSEVGLTLGESDNLSLGGACVSYEGERAPTVGECVQMEVDVPGRGPVEVEAEVRWASKRQRKVGLQFRGTGRVAIAAFLTAFLGATQVASAAAVSVPEFDPNADVAMDMEAGPERPDEYNLLQAFEQQYTEFDKCVAEAKGRDHRQWKGDVHVEVLLNPDGHVPLGVNTTVPRVAKKKQGLRECLRSAIATADYPSYDGPPVVVEFDFELDAGTEWEEE